MITPQGNYGPAYDPWRSSAANAIDTIWLVAIDNLTADQQIDVVKWELRNMNDMEISRFMDNERLRLWVRTYVTTIYQSAMLFGEATLPVPFYEGI